MVSFWPWKRDASSAASFEKTLSALSHKIADTQARLGSTRSRSRRVRVLWTLYLSFAYLVYAIVDILVVGTHKMGPYEWSAVAGGPVLIYVTRTTVATYYHYRIETLSSRLAEQQTERAKTIKKLKEATKYDTTQELLEKYGGAEARPRSRGDEDRGDAEDEDAHGKRPRQGIGGHHPSAGMQTRTNLPPPPTANIQRRPLSPAAGPPQSGPETAHPPHGGVVSPDAVPVTEEFAPNAFTHTPPHAHTQYDGATDHHWYDRVLDLLLGEDETAAKNRIVLICQRCRLVNGQAPPGTKALGELGMWKCFSCGATNGEVDEGREIVRQVLEASGRDRSPLPPPAESGPVESDAEAEFDEESGGYRDEVEESGVVGGVNSDGSEGNAAGARRRKGKK